MKFMRAIDRLEIALIELEYAAADYLHDESWETGSDGVSHPRRESSIVSCARLALDLAIDVLRSIDGAGRTEEGRDPAFPILRASE